MQTYTAEQLNNKEYTAIALGKAALEEQKRVAQLKAGLPKAQQKLAKKKQKEQEEKTKLLTTLLAKRLRRDNK